MLVSKHCFDFVSYTVDLIAFSSRKIHLMRYKLALDIVSICLIVVVQCKLFSWNHHHQVDSSVDANPKEEEQMMRIWITMEVYLFYMSLFVQVVFFTCILWTVNSAKF